MHPKQKVSKNSCHDLGDYFRLQHAEAAQLKKQRWPSYLPMECPEDGCEAYNTQAHNNKEDGVHFQVKGEAIEQTEPVECLERDLQRVVQRSCTQIL